MKVSIITVSYNSGNTIDETIQSVTSQSYKNIEYIIVDGCSTDNTFQIINDNKKYIDKYISEPDEGIYDAMNKGIKLATGDVISILNSDDIFFDNYVIENVINCFIEKNCQLIYGNIDYIDNKLNKVRFWNSKKYIKNSFKDGWHPPHPSLFVKSSVYKLNGSFDLRFKIAADFDIMLRFFEFYNISNSYLNKTLVTMKIGGASNNIKGIIKGNREIKQAFKKYKISPNFFYMFYRYLPKLRQYFDLFLQKNHLFK